MAGVQLQPGAWNGRGVQLGVLGRHRVSASPWCTHVGTWIVPSSKPHGRVSSRRSWATPLLPRRNASR